MTIYIVYRDFAKGFNIMLLHSCKKCWFLLFLRWFQCQPARKSTIKMTFMRSEVVKLIGNLKPFQFFFTARNAGNMSSCACDGQIKTIQKHMISLKRTPKTSNQTIILPYSKIHSRIPASTNISFLNKKHKFHSFHVFFSLVYSPPLGVVKKNASFRIVKVLNFGSARTFSPKRQLFWRILGINEMGPVMRRGM